MVIVTQSSLINNLESGSYQKMLMLNHRSMVLGTLHQREWMGDRLEGSRVLTVQEPWADTACQLHKKPESWSMTVLQPQTKERTKTNINDPTSMFQLFGVYCREHALG